MATGEGVAPPANGLGNRRTQRPRNVRAGDSGLDLDGGTRSGGAVAATPAGADPGVGVAAGEAGSAPALEWDTAANIHVRMIRAQAQAKKLEKEGVNKPNGAGGKQEREGFFANGFITHDAVTHEAMRILTRNGLHFQPILKAYRQEGNRTIIDMDGVITNVDKPEERLVFPGFGYGVDQSDKGPGKAMSYAKKMVLSQALMLNTHEDIEAHNTEYQPATDAKQVKEAQATTEVAVRTWADAFKSALDGCQNQRDLKRIRAENAHMMKSENVPDVTRDFFSEMIAQLQSDLPA